jgi:Uma2 family endonuclease
MVRMGLPAEKRKYTVEEYLRMEQAAVSRHEYHDGEILAMAGGTFTHSAIVSNVNRAVGNALVGKPCRAMDSNLKIGISRERRFVYPDVSVICGPPQFDLRDPSRQTVINPRLVIEVLSPSTEAYDRGTKFDRYRELESFEEYVLVAQDHPSVQTFFKQPDGTWLLTPYAGMEAIAKLRSLGVELTLTDVYAGVEFPDPATLDAEADAFNER